MGYCLASMYFDDLTVQASRPGGYERISPTVYHLPGHRNGITVQGGETSDYAESV